MSNIVDLRLPYAKRVLIELNELYIRNDNSIDAFQIARALDASEDNESLIATICKNYKISKKQIVRALAAVKVEADLGAYPTSVENFFSLYVAKRNLTCQYNGVLKIGRADVLYESFLADALSYSTCNKLGYTDASIKVEQARWYDESRRLKFEAIRNSVVFKAPNDALWMRLVELTCNADDVSHDLAAAVMKNFAWQVKRKLYNLPVTNHMMPVFHGTQGCGKTVLVSKLIKPLAELAIPCDFDVFADDRRADVFSYYVLFFDEMSAADRADMARVKRLITADTISYRPMTTNKEVTRQNRATMIGCSNKQLSQLINDPTGVRRFAPLDYLSKEEAAANWKELNKIDAVALWQSIDPNGPDPLDAHRDELAKVQGENRRLSPVESFAANANRVSDLCSCVVDKTYTIEQLYTAFAEHQRLTDRSGKMYSLDYFQQELKRLCKADKVADTFQFVPQQTNRGMYFKFKYRG